VNGTGDRAVGDDVAAHLTSAGLLVGTVTAGASLASGIEYPASEESGAQRLAAALGKPAVLRPADLPHVTVVLGTTDSAALVQAVDDLAVCR
jgi:LytR cell envelope-related transcriptional attenuator